MPSQYNGQAGNVQLPTAKTISSATNATPIVVGTTTPHLLTSGDFVDVSLVQGNTAANGSFVVQVVDSTHAILVGSVGNGAYTTGGTLQSLGMGQTLQIPSDSDALSAASVNVALEGLADRTASIAVGVGAYSLHSFFSTFYDDSASGTPENTNWLGSTFTFSAQNTWQQVTSLPGPPQSILQPGDVIEYTCTLSLQWADTSNTGIGFLVGLAGGFSTAGNLPVSPTVLGGSGVVVPNAAVNGGRSEVVLRGRWTVPANVQTFVPYLYAFTRSGAFAQIAFTIPGDHAVYGAIYRNTGKPV